MEATLTKKEAFLSTLNKANSTHSVEALRALEEMEFPNRKSEDWKYTRVAKLLNAELQHNTSSIADFSQYKIEGLDSYLIVIANGEVVTSSSELTTENGVTISQLNGSENGLNTLADDSHIFSLLNTAYQHDGIYIHVEKNAIIEKPIEIINLIDGNNTIAQTRKYVVAETSAQVHIVDSFYSADEAFGFTNNVTEVFVKDNAKVHYDKIQFESENNWLINSEYVHQEDNSTFTINTITLNGGTVRNGLNIKVDGSNCETYLNGLYLLQNKQHVDNHTVVDHLKPHCMSSELYKGMVDDNATGVFNGKVFVREDAQKIEAFQQNNNIVMTDTATMNSKPELEIYADDVKCSHGSTTGQFDEQAVFYLRARGISEDSARKLLVAAFAGDVLNYITNDAVRAHLDKQLKTRFGWDF